MTYELTQFGLTSFVTLFVVIDPIGVVPLFHALTQNMNPLQRRKTQSRAVIVALAVVLFFLCAGRFVLSYLGVSIYAFSISGGILLFATALPMLLGSRPGLQGPEASEKSQTEGDVAIFPLAIPLLAGPGTIATVLLLSDHASGSPPRLGILFGVVTLTFGISWLILSFGNRILAKMGEGKMHIVTRVLGIVLAALAVQFVLNGISDYVHTLK